MAAMSPRKFVYCVIASGQSIRREIPRYAQNDMGVDCQIEGMARENLSPERKGFDVCN